MRRPAIVLALLLLPAGFGAGCAGEGSHGKEGSGTAPAVPVEVVRVEPVDLAQGVEVTGTLAPRRDARVKSEFGGTVEEVYVTQWVRVGKGQPLARIDSRTADAQVARARAAVEAAKASRLESEAAAARAERELSRAKLLQEDGLITRQAFEEAVTHREASSARLAAAGAQVRAAEEELRAAEARASKSVLRAPFDGVVADRLVAVGEVVGEIQKELFRIVDNRLLDLTVSVPSTEMGAVRVGQTIEFATDAFPGKTFRGTVRYINPAVNPSDRSVGVVAEVRNDPEVLKGGLFVNGRILTGSRRAVLAVPRGSLRGWDLRAGTAELFVAENGTARRREVGTGIAGEGRVEVVAGLSPGEAVITRGAFNVRDGDPVQVVPGEGAR